MSLVHKRTKYNPPKKPYQCEAWERLVRSCKRVFYAILGWRSLFDEILNKTMCLVEGSFNARPLTHLSNDPHSLAALTPNHFHLGQHSLTFPSLRSSEKGSHSERYPRAQSYAIAIWKWWLSEYVPTLSRRIKRYASPEDSSKTGDLLCLVESTRPKGHYPPARIMSLNYGKDNTARSSNNRTVSGNYTRPLVKLVTGPAPSGVKDVYAI